MESTVLHKELSKFTMSFHPVISLLHVKIKPNVNFTGFDSIELMQKVEEFVGNRSHKAVIEMGVFTTSSKEARKKYIESAYINNYRKADAFVVNSMLTRLMINSFISIAKPKIPTRAFDSVEDAMIWIESTPL